MHWQSSIPRVSNLGGGGFMTIRLKDGTKTFLDFRERAPLAATKTMYLDAKGDIVPRASLDGYLSVGVPGSVMGFETAREKYGTKSRQDLIALKHFASPKRVSPWNRATPQVSLKQRQAPRQG